MTARVLDPEGVELHRGEFVARAIRPGAIENLTFRLEPALAPGSVRLEVVARLGGAEVARESVEVDVGVPGELRRKGILEGLRALDVETRIVNHRLAAGAGFLVDAPFRNTGQVDVEAELQGYITRAGRVLRTIESDPVVVAPGETESLRVLVLDAVEPGRYTIVGRAHYGGKVTPEFEAILTLDAPAELATTGSTPAPGPLLVLAAAGAAVALLRRHRG